MKRITQVLRVWIYTLGGSFGFVVDRLALEAGRITAYALLVMTLIVTIDVAKRFLLGSGLVWVVEFSAYLLVLMVFLGLVYTLREGSHIRIVVLLQRLPKKVQDWLDVISSAIFLAYAVFLGLFTWKYTVLSFALKTTSQTATNVIVWPIQLLMPLGLALMSLLLILNLYTGIRRIVLKNRSSPD